MPPRGEGPRYASSPSAEGRGSPPPSGEGPGSARVLSGEGPRSVRGVAKAQVLRRRVEKAPDLRHRVEAQDLLTVFLNWQSGNGDSSAEHAPA